MVALLMVLLSSVLVTTVVLAHMPQWRPFVTPTDIFGTFEWEAHPGNDPVNPQI